MKSLKNSSYIFLISVISMLTSCEGDDSLNLIAGLDFEITILNEDGTEVGVVPSVAVLNERIKYTVDFGATLDDDTDVFETDGDMVTYEYPNEGQTYEIKVTASLSGKEDVYVVKYYTVVVEETLVGTWKLAPEAGALGVGPSLDDLSWWTNTLEDVSTRTCLFDDEYVFNSDGTFQNILGSETWVEGWQGVANEGCATPVFPHNGTNTATWEYDETTGTITINGTGAYLGLAKIYNGGELISPSEAVDSISYSATLIGNTLTVDIEIANGFWSFKLVK